MNPVIKACGKKEIVDLNSQIHDPRIHNLQVPKINCIHSKIPQTNGESIPKVYCRYLKRLFRSAAPTAVVEKAGFILFAAVSEESHGPGVLVSKIPKAT
jgi:hypothetical protein